MSEPLLELEGRNAFFRLVGCKRMPEAVTTRPLGNAGVFAVADRKFKRPFRAAPPARPPPPPPGHGRVTRRAAPAGAACSPAARGGTQSGQVPLLGRGFCGALGQR